MGEANAEQVWSLSLPPGPLTKMWVLVPTSVVLQRLHDDLPTDRFDNPAAAEPFAP
jgi:hypothetical protein